MYTHSLRGLWQMTSYDRVLFAYGKLLWIDLENTKLHLLGL